MHEQGKHGRPHQRQSTAADHPPHGKGHPAEALPGEKGERTSSRPEKRAYNRPPGEPREAVAGERRELRPEHREPDGAEPGRVVTGRERHGSRGLLRRVDRRSGQSSEGDEPRLVGPALDEGEVHQDEGEAGRGPQPRPSTRASEDAGEPPRLVERYIHEAGGRERCHGATASADDRQALGQRPAPRLAGNHGKKALVRAR
jgi:hypothetical protein